MEPKTIAVFGAAGKMGMGIVETILAQIKDCLVVAFDVGLDNPKRYDDVVNKLKLDLFHLKNGNKLLIQSNHEVLEHASRIAWYETNPKNMAHWLPECDLIIEAVFEKEDLKKNLYAEIEKYTKPSSPILTNTSTIKISQLAEDLEHPESLIGFHFFNPVPVMRAVEIIPQRHGSIYTMEAAEHFASLLGK
ncbi:MAG: 3-hydroxyacyl-CoA dehydrogenase family protein, partial [bacterium]|nr:3-hydroxyacyl-CoA dehydrogenase family protein [bacterium]